MRRLRCPITRELALSANKVSNKRSIGFAPMLLLFYTPESGGIDAVLITGSGDYAVGQKIGYDNISCHF